MIACGSSNGLLKIWNLREEVDNFVEICEFQREESNHYPICIIRSTSENLLIIGSDESVIKIWNVAKKNVSSNHVLIMGSNG